MATDLGAILKSVEDGTAENPTGSAMPNGTITTSLEKEKKKARMVFDTKTFYISDDISGREFAAFINWIIEPGKGRTLLREDSTFTQTGELVRICDYLRRADDNGDDEMEDTTPYVGDEDDEDLKRAQPDITKEEPKEQKEIKEGHEGERFTGDDYVSE